MKVIDLTHTSKHKINAEIEDVCGGKSLEKFWITEFQKGLGGFTFFDHQSDTPDERFRAALAFFKAGLGVYCRNMYKNYLVLIPENMITKLEITKKQDVILPHRFSLFTILKKMGVSDHTAGKYLMPKEIIVESNPQFTIRTSEIFLTLDIEKISPDSLIRLLKKTKFADLLDIQIASPQIQNII